MSSSLNLTNRTKRLLQKLGVDIRDARRRRHLTMEMIANRAGTTRKTISRIEAGDPAVSMGLYLATLHALGLSDRLTLFADPSLDVEGTALSLSKLPDRVRPRG